MLSGPCKYSENEKKLIKSISPYWGDLIEKHYIAPLNLYKILAIDCFLSKKEGVEVDALRRALQTLECGKLYRLTPEFEELISCENNPN